MSNIKLCIFDMGGVVVTSHSVGEKLLPYLGLNITSFNELPARLKDILEAHTSGLISEETYWDNFSRIMKVDIPKEESLFAHFFSPVVDEKVVSIIRDLKSRGMRVVLGTNVLDAHYDYHKRKGQYDIFDKVYASNKIGVSKPRRAFWDYILYEEEVEAKNAFFTDDSKENIKVASSIGINTHLYTGSDLLLKSLKKYRII